MKNPLSGWLGRKPPDPSKLATIKDALAILGKDNVILESKAKKVLRVMRLFPLHISYTRGVLEKCAEENTKGEHYSLFPKYGLPMLRLRELYPKEFCVSSVWDNGSSWLSTTSMPDYLLVNLKLQMIRSRKAAEIGKGFPKLGRVRYYATHPNLTRLRLSTVAELLLVYRFLHDERLLAATYHAASVVDQAVPIIGGYDEQGVLVYTLPKGVLNLKYGIDSLGVLMCVHPERKQASSL